MVLEGLNLYLRIRTLCWSPREFLFGVQQILIDGHSAEVFTEVTEHARMLFARAPYPSDHCMFRIFIVLNRIFRYLSY